MSGLRMPMWAMALGLLLGVSIAGAQNWPQAAGPGANWRVDGSAPIKWSVVRNENVLWRTPMPEAGMSAVTVWGDYAFTTIHVPIKSSEAQNFAKDIIGYCLDAHTGKILWSVELPGSVEIELAGGFTDGTVFAPIADEEHVWFFNRCGSMGCYDRQGKNIWLREFTPRYKHNNRQFEPVLVGDAILYVEVYDKVNGSKMTKWTEDRSKTQRVTIPPEVKDEKDVWTYIHGIDKHTGKILWREQTGTSVHNTPVVGQLADGSYAVVHARGGAHGTIEKPYGLSLTSLAPGREGQTLWSIELPHYDPPFANHWNEKEVYGFDQGDHIVLDTSTGKLLRRQPLYKSADVWRFDRKKASWSLAEGVAFKAGRGYPNTNQANQVVGDWHYFLSHDACFIGRVQVKTGKVEYLEVPNQLLASSKSRDEDVWLWDKKNTNRPTDAAGFVVGNKGNTGTGWGHISAASPTLVGHYLFFPVVTGTVYVIDTTAPVFNGDALVAINDLGPGGDTWTLASFSYAHGRLYMHTMKEIIAIGPASGDPQRTEKP